MQIDLTSRRTLVNSLNIDNFKVAVEVGVRTGWFSKYILDNTKMEVHSIDPWVPNAELSNADECFEICKNILSPYGERSKMIKAFSPEVTAEYTNDSIDFVYIDGLHDYESVKKDIVHWFPKIRSKGILSGHDFNQQKWPGVCRAVVEFCEENNLKFQLTGLDGNEIKSRTGEIDDWDSNEFSWVIIKP